MASFGENLRRERELRGITLRDIADATKISVRFLQALEQDRMDILPGGIFRRAFVRQYARHIGLDPERAVAEFVFAHREEEAEAEAAPVPPRQLPVRGALAVAACIAAMGIMIVLRPSRDKARSERVSVPVGLPAATPFPAADRVYPPPSSVIMSEPEGLILTLSAQQACWVAARVDGETVLNRTLSVGEKQTIEATGEIVLSVGNAGGLEFTVNNRPGLPLGRSGEVRRNIVITRQSLPSLVQEASLKTPHS